MKRIILLIFVMLLLSSCNRYQSALFWQGFMEGYTGQKAPSPPPKRKHCYRSSNPQSKTCWACYGTGLGNILCWNCNGSGIKRGRKCSICGGRGFNKCWVCYGTGITWK